MSASPRATGGGAPPPLRVAFVSFADGKYKKIARRLCNTLKAVGFTGDCIIHEKFSEIDSPTHAECPYAFKAFAIRKHFTSGKYDVVIWVDSSVYAKKPVDAFAQYVYEKGHVFFDNIGFTIGEFTSDECLRLCGMSREEAFQAPMIMAGIMGFSTRCPLSAQFIERFCAASQDGSFVGPWWYEGRTDGVRGHRHDQSAASIIIKQLGIPVTNAQETFFTLDEHEGRLHIAESVCLWCKGL
jgi:hypothetical protein